MKTNFRSKVMKTAWTIRKIAKQAWVVCLRKAWQIYKLECALRRGVANFWYTKADGTIREAVGTLRNIPSGTTFNGKRVTKQGYHTIKYYDVEKNGFRSFKMENVGYPSCLSI